jgi:23S rRNA (uracil1939-C5)-methyltransferase
MSEHTTITAYNSDGEGIGKTIEGKTLFIPFTAIGETVSYQITEEKARYARGALNEIKTHSIDRIKPLCPYFQTCGGCSIMHLTYEAQLKAKEERVRSTLKRIANLPKSLVEPIRSAPAPFNYRTKVTLHYKDNTWGFYEKKSNSLVRIQACSIFNHEGNTLLQAFLQLNKTAPLQEVTLRSSSSHKEQLLVLKGKHMLPPLETWYTQLKLKAPSLSGLVYLPEKGKPIILGSPELHQAVCDKEFLYSYDSFFQIFPEAAQELFKTAIQKAELISGCTVVDAHCGVGVIGLLAAPYAKKVEGYEIVSNAIHTARKNAKLQGVENARFFIKALQKVPSSVDCLFLNPPRGGCLTPLLENTQAKKVVYISCDPATMARDLKILSKNYFIQSILPFDLFPQTMHVETISILKIKKTKLF